LTIVYQNKKNSAMHMGKPKYTETLAKACFIQKRTPWLHSFIFIVVLNLDATQNTMQNFKCFICNVFIHFSRSSRITTKQMQSSKVFVYEGDIYFRHFCGSGGRRSLFVFICNCQTITKTDTRASK
jgi:hypothetical protein